MNVVITTLNSGRGSGTIVAQQMQELINRGHSVTYVSTMLPPKHLSIPREVKIQLVDLKGKPIPVHEHLAIDGNKTIAASQIDEPQVAEEYIGDYSAAIAEAVKQEGADVIVAHHSNLNTVASARVAQETGIPLVTHVHGTCIRGYQESGAISQYAAGNISGRGYTWGQIRQSMHDSDSLIAISRFVNESLIRPQLDFRDWNKVTVIGNYVDQRLFDQARSEDLADLIASGKLPTGPDGNPQRGILYLGPMTERKGASVVAGMAEHLSDLDIPIYLMGKGDGDRLERLGPNIHYLGSPTETEKAALFVHAGLIGVTPNLSVNGEDFGMVQKEYAVSRVPVIAPASGAYREHIKEGVTGFLVPHDQQTARVYADKVRAVLQLGEERLHNVRENGRQFVLDNFGREMTLGRFIRTIEGTQHRGPEGNRKIARR